MDDSLAARINIVERYIEIGAVLAELLDLLPCYRVADFLGPRFVSGDVVVYRGDRQIWTPYGPVGETQTLESLRRGDFVHQVQVDVENCGFAFRFSNEMRVPDLFEHRLRHFHHLSVMFPC